MHEKRKHERIEVPLKVKATWPGKEEQIGVTRDVSDGGAYLQVRFSNEPAEDTVMELQLTTPVMGKEAPVLAARVARRETDGIAFEFLHHPPE